MKKTDLEKLIAKHRLVNIFYPLSEAHAQLIPETIQEAHEIQKDRMKDRSLWSKQFIVGNGFIYTIENNEAVLYVTNAKFNPVLKQKSIADAINQISRFGNYDVKADDFSLIQMEATKKNGGAERYALFDLGLTKQDNECSFYEIDTVKYNKLNKTQRAFAEQVHGKGKQFTKVMSEMKKAGITKTRIFVLNPEYVQKVAKEGPVARVGGLDGFNLNYDFFACTRYLGDDNIRIRGVRRESIGETINQRPSFDQVMALADPYMFSVPKAAFAEELKELYEKK